MKNNAPAPSEPGGNEITSHAEFTKIQELLYELRVDQVMTRPAIAVTSRSSMAEAKSILRARRISGLPVTDGGTLVGILSLEDVMTWLEEGGPEATVDSRMTRKVHTVMVDDPAVQAIAKFGRFKVGRLPVIDRAGSLRGIVTPGDIIGRALRVMDARYREREARRAATDSAWKGLLEEGSSLVLKYAIAPRDFQRAGSAATRIRRALNGLGVDPALVRRAGIAAYEAEMNLAIHTDSGGEIVAQIDSQQLLIETSDSGPGIPDLEKALTPGYSTAPDWIRELGFGAGMGLVNIKGCADGFSIESQVGKGTALRAAFALETVRDGPAAVTLSKEE